MCSVDSDRSGPLDLGIPERLATSIGLAALWGVILCESLPDSVGPAPFLCSETHTAHVNQL